MLVRLMAVKETDKRNRSYPLALQGLRYHNAMKRRLERRKYER